MLQKSAFKNKISFWKFITVCKRLQNLPKKKKVCQGFFENCADIGNIFVPKMYVSLRKCIFRCDNTFSTAKLLSYGRDRGRAGPLPAVRPDDVPRPPDGPGLERRGGPQSGSGLGLPPCTSKMAGPRLAKLAAYGILQIFGGRVLGCIKVDF